MKTKLTELFPDEEDYPDNQMDLPEQKYSLLFN